MTENLRESISALMDNEANEVEVHRVLKSMQDDEQARATWHRYQIASAALKGQLNKHTSVDISSRVSALIEDESIEVDESTTVTKVSVWSKVSKPMTSVAVAASVAFLVVFGTLQVDQQTGSTPQPGLANQSSPSSLSSPSGIVLNGVQTVAASASSPQAAVQQLTPAQKRLRNLMHKHAQQADLSRGNGIRPYVQLVDMQENRR